MVETLEEVTGVILAGGLGSRLRSVLSDRPKVLAEVGGRPFLTYLLDQMVAAWLERVVICIGYLGDQVRSVLGDTYGALSLAYSQETTPLGTAGALRLARPLMHTRTILAMNGDSYCKASLSDFCRWHIERRARASILLTKVPDASRFGTVELNKGDAVVRFDEKDPCSTAEGWINAGVYLLDTTLLERVPTNAAVSLERELFPTLIGSGLFGWKCTSRFIDIGTPKSYRQAERFFSSET